MAFQFKQSSCVAVGTFNVYVVQPEFLREIHVFPEEIALKFEANLTQPGFRFSVEDRDARWTVRPDRLTVESRDARKDCGHDLADTLDALPWTPLTAIGCNVVYSAPRSEDIDRLFCDVRIPPDFGLNRRGSHFSIKRDAVVFNVQVSSEQGEHTLSINAHEELTQHQTQKALSQHAVTAARQFFERRRASRILAATLLGIEVVND